ncbi:uncharacterized protein LOC128955304 [Oppia nitens]|uniref:uncharacterized protein LOC128955304 n=1 Tax=Oppia nitens TaxID=1686743 RepID=UPI0023DC8847|nr:uncharacterized protein LOC128955304 [Oppia nitens]
MASHMKLIGSLLSKKRVPLILSAIAGQHWLLDYRRSTTTTTPGGGHSLFQPMISHFRRYCPLSSSPPLLPLRSAFAVEPFDKEWFDSFVIIRPEAFLAAGAAAAAGAPQGHESYDIGIVWDPLGYIITSNMWFHRGMDVCVQFADGTCHPGQVVDSNSDCNIATIKLKSNVQNLRMVVKDVATDSYSIGDRCFTVQSVCPSLANSLHEGVIINNDLKSTEVPRMPTQLTTTFPNVMQHTAPVFNMSRFSAVINGDGKLIAVSIYNNYINVNFALRLYDLEVKLPLMDINNLNENFGLSTIFYDPNPDYRQYYIDLGIAADKLPHYPGALVLHSTQDPNTVDKGLLITFIDGLRINTKETYVKACKTILDDTVLLGLDPYEYFGSKNTINLKRLEEKDSLICL